MMNRRANQTAFQNHDPLDLIAEILVEGIRRLRRREAARRCEIRREKSAGLSENGLDLLAPRSPVVAVEPLEKGVGK